MGTFLEGEQWCANLHPGARAGQEARNVACLRGRDFYHSLLGLDGDKRLADYDVIAFGDMPSDDFRFL
jgi:hypothetical protein